jgi:heme-degrading monooxygenase HmoA
MEARDAWGYLIVWEFRPKPGMKSKFEKIYGSNGPWAEFFRRGKGYCGTELAQESNDPGRYLTFDFWTSRQAYEQFRESNLAEYKRIDEQCEEMTQTELELGRFERVEINGEEPKTES